MLELDLGLGTPYGELGAAVEYDVIPEFGFVAGGGVGDAGPQAVFGFRLRARFGAVALGLEIAWSGGPFDAEKCRLMCLEWDRPYRHYDFAHWINLAPTLEFRTQAGFDARIYFGAGKLLNEGAGECVAGVHCGYEGELGFVGISLGGAG